MINGYFGDCDDGGDGDGGDDDDNCDDGDDVRQQLIDDLGSVARRLQSPMMTSFKKSLIT